MADKSYKDYLQEQNAKEKASSPAKSEKNKEEINFVESDIPLTVDTPAPTMTVLDNTAITETLEEQREESRVMLETITASNAKIVEAAEKIVESNAESNTKLIEAIGMLTDKIELLETKLEAIENLEIPTPIVNLSMPSKTVQKQVHRDKKGIITHITESEVFDEDEGE